jgi:hypothetical protein
MSVLLAALAGLAGLSCRFDPSGVAPSDARPGADAGDATASDGGLDAATDGGPTCSAGALRCQGATVEICLEDQWQLHRDCYWGCSEGGGGAHCGDPWFTNGLQRGELTIGATAFTAEMGTTVIDTDSGTITTPSGVLPGSASYQRLIPRGDLPSLRVIGFTTILVPEGARIEVVGSAGLVLVASTDITIGGELVSTGQTDGTPGAGGYPGGGSGASGGGSGGGQPGELTLLSSSGGGGGGHAAPGGAGESFNSNDGGAGGAEAGVPGLDPLEGGSGGGYGSEGLGNGGGGGGGGALMLLAGSLVEILDSGVVNVGGGGGSGAAGAGGGGAGGAVLIEAHDCSIAGILAANGGGGGGGGATPASGTSGQPGADPAPGGGQGGGAGGAGTELQGSPGDGNGVFGAGGGGAAGRIRVNTVTSASVTGVVSPAEGSAGFVLGLIRTQ